MNTQLATVTEIYDDVKFIIKFTVKENIEDAIAYPIDVDDVPEIGETVLVYEIESIFGYSFLYKKLRLADHTRLKLRGSEIDLSEQGISITTTIQNDKGETTDRTILIGSDGEITISGQIINISVQSLKTSDSGQKPSINLIAPDGAVTVDASTIQFPPGKVIPNSNYGSAKDGNKVGGPFNCIPRCKFDGSPHCGFVFEKDE